MKLVALALAALLALALCACASPGSEPTPTPVLELATPAARATPAPTQTPGAPVFEPGKSVAHVFGSGEDATLYCGFEALNTGNCSAVLESVKVTFDVEGVGSFESEFAPIAADADVLAPGGKTFCALWLPARKAVPEGASVTLTLELIAKQSDAFPLPLTVKNARVIQNYPGFATVSGSIWNDTQEECPLNVIYTAFYDAAGELLGVYHFSKNAAIYGGEYKNFVVHMKQLPIEGLSEAAASVQTHAFGVE